ncbi:MAG TPA: SGNH/GDSL hydrolase family protein [Terriglobales bacterium]|nr:SGNH/GDSL hydrolase family protein [Terriglobales bacterium]
MSPGKLDASKRDLPIHFGGRPFTTIRAGEFVISDPVETRIPELSTVSISLYVPEQPIAIITCHELAVSTNFVGRGNTFKHRKTKMSATSSWYFLSGIDVQAEESAIAVVALGDSITDGMSSTQDANRRWPDVLAVRLQNDPELRHVAVLNAGIIGNRVLRDEIGPNAIARFDRDVLRRPGVKCLVLLEGINDIDWIRSDENVSDSAELISGLRKLIERAHSETLFVIGGTIPPYGGAEGFIDRGNSIRHAVNTWYRTENVVDGIADFDQALRNPEQPDKLDSKYDSGDHVHPNDAGYAAMAMSINLELIRSCAEGHDSPMQRRR